MPTENKVKNSVTVIRGKAKTTGEKIEIAYLGYDYVNARFWVSLFFENPLYGAPEYVPEKNLIRKLNNYHPQCSLLLSENSLPEKIIANSGETFIIPRFINTQMDVSAPLDEMLKNSRSGFGRIARWVKSQKLDYEIETSEEAQHVFYDRMYLPFVAKRHQDKSLIVTFENIFSPAVKSEIIMVKKNGERIAGLVMHYWENRPTLGFFGVKEGVMNEILKWNTSAMYYFAVIEAKKKDINMLHLGGSPAFMLNGINAQKARLGAKIDAGIPWQDSGMVKMTILKKSDALLNYLAANPFAFVGDNGKLTAAIWLPPGRTISFDDTKNQIAFAEKLGIEKAVLFRMKSNPAVKELSKRTGIPDIMITNF